MKESVIWGAIVGIALGVMVTFALARGVLALPWQVEAPAEAPARALPARALRALTDGQDLDRQTRTSLSPAWSPTSRLDDAEPRRPARPVAEGSVDASHRGLSRS